MTDFTGALDGSWRCVHCCCWGFVGAGVLPVLGFCWCK